MRSTDQRERRIGKGTLVSATHAGRKASCTLSDKMDKSGCSLAGILGASFQRFLPLLYGNCALLALR